MENFLLNNKVIHLQDYLADFKYIQSIDFKISDISRSFKGFF